MQLTSSEKLALVWVIVLAFFFLATAVINLRASNPRARSVQLAWLMVILVLTTVAFEVSGGWAAAVVLVLGICAEFVHAMYKRGRVA